MGLKLDSGRLRSSFALADSDASGDIDFDEFLMMMTAKMVRTDAAAPAY